MARIRRILFAYAGALLLLAIGLPFAALINMGGHSLIYLVIFISPIGIAGGLWYFDKKYGCCRYIASLKAIVAFITSIACVAGIALIDESRWFAFNGWILIPVIAPPIAAVLSSKFGDG